MARRTVVYAPRSKTSGASNIRREEPGTYAAPAPAAAWTQRPAPEAQVAEMGRGGAAGHRPTAIEQAMLTAFGQAGVLDPMVRDRVTPEIARRLIGAYAETFFAGVEQTEIESVLKAAAKCIVDAQWPFRHGATLADRTMYTNGMALLRVGESAAIVVECGEGTLGIGLKVKAGPAPTHVDIEDFVIVWSQDLSESDAGRSKQLGDQRALHEDMKVYVEPRAQRMYAVRPLFSMSMSELLGLLAEETDSDARKNAVLALGIALVEHVVMHHRHGVVLGAATIERSVYDYTRQCVGGFPDGALLTPSTRGTLRAIQEDRNALRKMLNTGPGAPDPQLLLTLDASSLAEGAQALRRDRAAAIRDGTRLILGLGAWNDLMQRMLDALSPVAHAYWQSPEGAADA